MTLTVHPFDTDFAHQIRNGGIDAYGNPPERAVSDGSGNPCRSCLKMIPEGHEMLIVAACPFPALQPYAETGPVFFCADDCTAYHGSDLLDCVRDGEDRLLKGYGHNNRILYGTGAIVPVDKIAATCEDIFRDDRVAYVDVRSSLNNCFTFRVTRGDDEQPSTRL